ncbi:conserved hypothetical protein [Luminiphilus syltensis NOR5-1B]|uniref:Fis family transcriptional regulator n=1 Tax=Luminiphilus syltensis NOR5-1B TaxID=565045 RepID=B8KXZ5_9GAMM|nr:hypothetical protein [Luminiphilus syltensis]EED34947.1 conserved hypothetical protein [Luminiphilus syltensis NOR5-1B]
MRKTDKKRERDIVSALTRVCNEALESIPDFAWITHFVDYEHFPESLVVVSVFKEDEQLHRARASKVDKHLSALVSAELRTIGVTLNANSSQIRCDTEEACEREHGGNWQLRYR